MAQTKEDISDLLSREIFKVKRTSLDADQLFFVYHHVREFKNYRVKIAERAQKAMTAKMCGKDYWVIWDWYCERIPVYIVLAGIEECRVYTVNADKQINSMNYFRKAVARRQEKSLKMYSPRISHENDNKYRYIEYLGWKAGHYPDHFKFDFMEEGANPDNGMEPGF